MRRRVPVRRDRDDSRADLAVARARPAPSIRYAARCRLLAALQASSPTPSTKGTHRSQRRPSGSPPQASRPRPACAASCPRCTGRSAVSRRSPVTGPGCGRTPGRRSGPTTPECELGGQLCRAPGTGLVAGGAEDLGRDVPAGRAPSREEHRDGRAGDRVRPSSCEPRLRRRRHEQRPAAARRGGGDGQARHLAGGHERSTRCIGSASGVVHRSSSARHAGAEGAAVARKRETTGRSCPRPTRGPTTSRRRARRGRRRPARAKVRTAGGASRVIPRPALEERASGRGEAVPAASEDGAGPGLEPVLDRGAVVVEGRQAVDGREGVRELAEDLHEVHRGEDARGAPADDGGAAGESGEQDGDAAEEDAERPRVDGPGERVAQGQVDVERVRGGLGQDRGPG